MKLIRKFFTMAVLLICAFFFLAVPTSAKNITKKVTMLQNSTRNVAMDSTDVTGFSVSNKKISAHAKDFFVTIKGVKTGSSTITFSIPALNQQYRIQVTVKAVSDVKKKSSAALKKIWKTLSKGTRYAYLDLNGDGVDELFSNGRIYYYNYQTNKCQYQGTNIKDLYISAKTKMIYTTMKKERETKEFVYFGRFFQPSDTRIFKLLSTGTGFRKYTKKGAAVYKAKAPYAFYDYFYDQDDYEYEALTEKQVLKRINQLVPKYQLVKMNTK